MKYTNQRVAILNFLKNNLNHPSVEEIYEEVKETLPRITKATVYKNLKALRDKELLKEVNVKGVSRFEAIIDSHHHIICKICGKIGDFFSDELIEYSLEITKNHKDFIIDQAETTFFGQCKDCE
ncbi:MAG: Fur family transcriptional regulator [Candidatus Hodarchaeales archaeon]|jgi:Fur family ferric uptake transcriptional regulator